MARSGQEYSERRSERETETRKSENVMREAQAREDGLRDEIENLRNDYERRIREMEHMGISLEEREELNQLRQELEGNVEEKRSIKIQRNANQQERHQKMLEWNQEREQLQNVIKSMRDDVHNLKTILDQQSTSHILQFLSNYFDSFRITCLSNFDIISL